MTRRHAGVPSQYGDLSPDYFYKGRHGRATICLEPHQLGSDRVISGHAWLWMPSLGRLLSKRCLTCRPRCSSPSAEWTNRAAFEKSFRAAFVLTRPSSRFGKHPGCAYRLSGPKTAATAAVDADSCICAMPLSILKTIDADFSLDFNSHRRGDLRFAYR